MAVTITDALITAVWTIVSVLAVARMARLLTIDLWPPVVALRVWWREKVPAGWDELVDCPWCMSPWFAIPAIWWGVTIDVVPADPAWVFAGWLALAYAAGWVAAKE